MDKKNQETVRAAKYAAFGDVIPAFLAPDHILDHYHANDEAIEQSDNAQDIEFFTADSVRPPGDMVIRERLYDAVEHNDIDVFMQPIVTLPQRQVTFYELYGRLRVQSGIYLPAQDYMPLAANEPMINHLDALLLSRCIKILGQQRRNFNQNYAYFINIKPSTLRNRVFMSNLLTLLGRNRSIAGALVFEISYRDFLMLSPGEQKILSGLADLGCRFSLDHVPEIPPDVKYLHTRAIHFVKIAAKTLLKESGSERGFSDIFTRKHNLDVNGIELIIEKIETEETLLQILDFDMKYGQGFLFGKPDFQGVYTR
tara:strand:+ start:6188 stop:7123 length:936 start_codon:yes stop_codon:yes gene_type:complete